MSRSKWKTPFIAKSILKQLSKKKIKTWSRNSTIYPAMIGLKLKIHNGKELIKREIKSTMIGHKLGEFVTTRKPFLPPKRKK